MSVEKDFPNPPGGKLVCEDGQTAIIRIKGGEITAKCVSPDGGVPVRTGGDYSLAFKNWLLAEVTERERKLTTPLTLDDAIIFDQRVYEFREWDGILVRVEFMPPELDARRGGGGRTMTA